MRIIMSHAARQFPAWLSFDVGQKMNGLSGAQLTLRSERIALPQFHNEGLRSRQVELAFGMPYEALLGAMSHSVQNAKEAGRFFARLAAIDPVSVGDYLRHFVSRMRVELDFQTTTLEVFAPFRNTPMDFPRPSPTRNFVLPAFFVEIASVPGLRHVIDQLPIRCMPDEKRPNKAPEPTPGSVTPRATDPKLH